jgi:hypothetical protein
MGLSESKRLISDYVANHIDDYYKLSFAEKCDLVEKKLNELPDYEKSGIMADADREEILVPLVRNLLREKRSPESIQKLVNGILEIFVTGSVKNKPYFYSEITADINEEWQEQHPYESIEHSHEIGRMIAAYDRQRI